MVVGGASVLPTHADNRRKGTAETERDETEQDKRTSDGCRAAVHAGKERTFAELVVPLHVGKVKAMAAARGVRAGVRLVVTGRVAWQRRRQQTKTTSRADDKR